MPPQTDLTQPIAPQPTFTPRSGETARQPASGPGKPRGRRAGRGRRADTSRVRGAGRGRGAGRRPRNPGGWLSRIWQGSLGGGLAVCVIAGSALIGAIATIVTRNQPGSALGLFVLAGTVAAALTVQPRTGRLIFPVPALSYLIAALVAGAVYDHSSSKTELLVGAAQWIASGFFVMVLATLLAVALTTVRWFMWRREQPGPGAPDRPAQGSRAAPRPQAGPPEYYGGFADRGDRRGTGATWPPPGTQPGTPLGTEPGTQPVQRPPGSQGTWGRDQRPGPRPDQGLGWAPDQRPGSQSGSGPYNFSGPYNCSSGA